MFVPLLIAVVLGYLLGSLPFGYLVARAKGVNIFEVGSRNPGATNVRRVLGNGSGNVVLILDALKGALATGWAVLAHLPVTGAYDLSDWGLPGAGKIDAEFWLLLGVAGLVGSVLGHSFSCFTKFRGGKGVATGAGGFFVLLPLAAVVGLVIWGAVVALTRYVSLASMLAAVSLPFSAYFLRQSPLLVTISAGIAVFVLIRHRGNISRLLAGTESKMGAKKTEPAAK